MKLDDARTLADLHLHDGEFLVAVETRKKPGNNGPPLDALATEPSLKLPPPQVGTLLYVCVDRHDRVSGIINWFRRNAAVEIQSQLTVCYVQTVVTRGAADASARHPVPTGRPDALPNPSDAAPDRRSAGGSLAARCVFGTQTLL